MKQEKIIFLIVFFFLYKKLAAVVEGDQKAPFSIAITVVEL